MDADSIENHVNSLGRHDFNAVASLLLRDAFNLTAINVDGPGDGGSDWSVYKDGGGSTTAAYQDTVQGSSWQQKALTDARKAVAKLKVTRYFFLTNRSRQRTDLKELEAQIASDL